MGQVLQPNAVTTHATRKAIQEASVKVSTYALAKQYGLNYRTVQKWRGGSSVEDRCSELLSLTECCGRKLYRGCYQW